MKMRKFFAGMAASALALSMMSVAASAEEVALTGTATARRDANDVRINIYNPWSQEEIDHAVESMEVFDYATEFKIKVKVTGADRFPSLTKLYVMGAENVDNGKAYWGEGNEANSNLVCPETAVSGDGEYVVTVTTEGTSWIYGENNFMAVYTDIPVAEWDAWLEANEGGDPSDLLSIVSIDCTFESEGGDTTESTAEESNAEEESKAEESKAEEESKADTTANNTTNNTTGNNTANNTTNNTANNTTNPANSSDNAKAGAAAGIALAGIAVAGAALVITKKKS